MLAYQSGNVKITNLRRVSAGSSYQYDTYSMANVSRRDVKRHLSSLTAWLLMMWFDAEFVSRPAGDVTQLIKQVLTGVVVVLKVNKHVDDTTFAAVAVHKRDTVNT